MDIIEKLKSKEALLIWKSGERNGVTELYKSHDDKIIYFESGNRVLRTVVMNVMDLQFIEPISGHEKDTALKSLATEGVVPNEDVEVLTATDWDNFAEKFENFHTYIQLKEIEEVEEITLTVQIPSKKTRKICQIVGIDWKEYESKKVLSLIEKEIEKN